MSNSMPLLEADPLSNSIDSFMQRVAADTYPPEAQYTVLRPGSLVSGRFRVERFVRRGGMGAIYRGTDLSSGTIVAIKSVGKRDRDSGTRFAREVSILSELSHPGIVHYLAHGDAEDGTLCFVMEWLEGEDLSERLLRAPLTLEESLRLMRRVCKALSFAHARGVVHRDIKPANLFLPDSDPARVKVLDFGIARLTEVELSLTTMGARVGTVGYMSPEQAMAERDVDARADVFALGCVFYECLTGKAPFASEHAVAVLAKVLQEEPARPSDLRGDLDPRFDELLARMLAKKRQDRLRDAAAVLAALDSLGERLARPDPKLRRSLSPRGADQRIISVILGRPVAGSEASAANQGLDGLEVKYGVRAAPLKGGGVLLFLSGQGEANDRASQAALCALELSQRRPDLMLAVATGLADTSGEVPVGVAIDRAALLLGNAQGATGVMLDEVTLGLVGLRFEVQKVEGSSMLLSARRDFDASRQLMGRPSPCVGRDRELRTLDEALNECMVEGVARVVVVTGPPGIGKSRLASEWLARGGRGGIVRTLFARADPVSAGSAWCMVQSLLRDSVGLREGESNAAQLVRLREQLSQLSRQGSEENVLEFLAALLGVQTGMAASPLMLAARSNPDIMREQMRRALQRWFDAESAKQPLLFVLEDLHWGDSPSVQFLHEWMRENSNRPLMVLALARPGVERQFPDFCEHALLQVRLPGLGNRAAQQLIHGALDRPLDAETTARLIRVADGNAFYLEELIRRVATGSSELPGSVIAMVQSRIDRLSQAARCVLLAATSFGERCWDRGIVEVLEESTDTSGALQELVEEEILVAVQESRYRAACEYRFRHSLLRDAAYAMMSPDERRAAHGVAADWLERQGEKDALLLADHFESANLQARACPWLARAAKKAIDAGDLAATIELANRGIAASQDGVERGRFLLMRCYADALCGQIHLDLTREAVDALAVGTPQWWLGLAVVVWAACMSGQPDAVAPYIALAREAPFTRDANVPQGQALLALVGGLVLFGKSAVAQDILLRAREGAGEAEPDDVFDAFYSAAQAALEAVAPINGRWYLERSLQESRRCAAKLGALGAFHGQSIALCYVAVGAMHLGLHVEARDACVESCRLARKASVKIRDPWPYLFLAKSYLRLGQPDEALQAIQPLLSSDDSTTRQMVPILVGEALLLQGKLQEAEEQVTAAFAGGSPRLQRLAACVLARAQLGRGETAAALRTIELAVAARTSSGLESGLDLMNLKAECLLACGQPEPAKRVVAETHDLVVKLAADITSPELKHSFLSNVEPCARALQLYEQLS
jgi:eukaryotic-like serine/threonine-protein kinase